MTVSEPDEGGFTPAPEDEREAENIEILEQVVRLMLNKTWLPVPQPVGKPEWTDSRGAETVELVRLSSSSRGLVDAQARLADPRLNRLVLNCVRKEVKRGEGWVAKEEVKG